ncbi:hypothetical protein CCAX7_40170 [Capsulimonas corticalis]|uniref:Uncharacterized protein n=1 Tax=Capsulimonas corticalis TaxID=2219043 RepID=A0A402D4Z0_9BACT|nr:potassium channel family protein [Capsulimonas corticalis]BDI31966.1 hypothetical protein CCAX7_40170 [Capsulimonas corticalis]
MRTVACLLSLTCLVFILWEAFETIVLPRTVSRSLRMTRLLYRYGWRIWKRIAERIGDPGRRETFLGYFGPMSLPMLMAIWAVGLIVAFGTLQWAMGMPLADSYHSQSYSSHVYMSGTTFFTLGYGDVTPVSRLGRACAVAESGVGLGFFALVIGYLPVLYQVFSRREITISLLDARAGTPPAAVELLRRYQVNEDVGALDALLKEWEHWSAELLESQLSYAVLAYYRSQHDRASWLSTLTLIMDTCALLIVGVDGIKATQARLTFAMARHAAVDISLVFNTKPSNPEQDRLPAEQLAEARRILAEAGAPLRDGPDADAKLQKIRALYEPYVHALGDTMLYPLPNWIAEPGALDNWQTSSWDHNMAGDRNHFG